MAYFEDAMKILDILPETKTNQKQRIILLENQVIVFVLLGKFYEYNDLLIQFEPMAIGLENKGLLGAYYSRIGHCEWWVGKLNQGIKTEKKALSLCRDAGNLEDAAYACMMLQFCYFHRGDFDQVLSLKKEALQLLEHQFNLRWYVWARCAASLAYLRLGCWNKSIEGEGKKAIEASEEYCDNSLIAFATAMLSYTYSDKGEVEQGIKFATMAVEKAPTPTDKLWAQPALAFAFCRDGKFEKTIEILEGLLPVYRAVRFTLGETWDRALLGEAYLLAGEHEKARQELERSIELAERYDIMGGTPWAVRTLAKVAMNAYPDQAAEYFDKSIDISRKLKTENNLALTYADYGRFYKQKGDLEQSKAYLIKALKILERLGTLIEPERIRKELAELPEP